MFRRSQTGDRNRAEDIVPYGQVRHDGGRPWIGERKRLRKLAQLSNGGSPMLWHGGVLCYPDGTPVAGVKNVPKPGRPVIGFVGANPPRKPPEERSSSMTRAYAHRRGEPASGNDRWGRSDREDGWFRFR